MDDDGGMQWWAEQGCEEQWEAMRDRARQDQRLLEEHRQWKHEHKEAA